MLRRCLSIISIIALITATSAPTFAAGPDPYLGAPYNGFDNYRRSAELTAGVYLRVPFSGGSRRSLSGTRFGLTVGARLPAYDRYDSRRGLLYSPKLFDLSIGLQGKESVRLNGISIIDMPTLYADEDDEDGGWGAGQWIFAGFVVFGAVILITTVAACSGEDDGFLLC